MSAGAKRLGVTPRLMRVRALVAAVRAGDRPRRQLAETFGLTPKQIDQARAVLRAKRQRKLLARLGNAPTNSRAGEGVRA